MRNNRPATLFYKKNLNSKLSDLLPSEIAKENDPTFARPSEEELEKITQRTRKALEKIIQPKIATATPVNCAEKQGPAQNIAYTPSQQGQSFNSGAKQRVIRMVNAQVDPMDPLKARTNNKFPQGSPAPPAPVSHSPTRKVTAKEQKEWKIPTPSSDNSKKTKHATDGRGHSNDKFAKLGEVLDDAKEKLINDRETRKIQEEDRLRQLAQKARDRAGLKASAALETTEESKERHQLRHERHKDRARDRNLARAAPDKRSRLQQERERDISEQIALGMPADNINTTGEAQFNQRLFNTTKGMDSSYGHDDEYNIYNKPLRDSNSLANNIYRPSKNIDKDNYGDDLEKIVKTNRFVPDKEFSGTDRSAQRSGPVQFEKDEEDPFGLDQFFAQFKRASGSTTTPSASATSSKRKNDKERLSVPLKKKKKY